MSKNPLIQYYAAILSISQLEGNGDAFTRQYDKICRVLTKEQSLVSKHELSLIPDLEEEEDTTETKPTPPADSETLDQNIKDTKSAVAHLKTIMTNLVEQPAMKGYSSPSPIVSCGQQSLSATSVTAAPDVNENFTGVHVSSLKF